MKAEPGGGNEPFVERILLGIVAGLRANELCEFNPWCARKLVRWSAFRRYADPGRAEMRAEELTAVINDRPGNLFKLITAVGFAVDALTVSSRRAVAGDSHVNWRPHMSRASWRSDLDHALAAASARALALSDAVASDRFSALDYAHNLAVASDRARSVGRALNHPRGIAVRCDLRDLFPYLNQAVNDAYSLARDLDSAHARIRDLNFYLGLGRTRGRELDLSYARARDLIRDFASALGCDLDRVRVSFPRRRPHFVIAPGDTSSTGCPITDVIRQHR